MAIEHSDATRERHTRFPRYEAASNGLLNYWYPVLRGRDLDQRGVTLRLCGKELLIIRDRRSGNVFATAARCLHRGVPLSEGKQEFPGTITCPFHGWTYDLSTGELVAALTDGPESSIVGKACLPTYPAQEVAGLVWVFFGDQPPSALHEVLPEEFTAPDGLVCAQVKELPGNWRLAMEGALDPSHPFYLHRSAWLSVPLRIPAARGRHWAKVVDDTYLTYETEPPVPEAQFPGLGGWPRHHWWQRGALGKLDVRGYLPCLARVEGLSFTKPFVVYSWYVPIDDKQYRWVQVLATRVSGLRRLWAKARYFFWLRWIYQGQFLNQDARMNELIHPYYAEQDGWMKERLFRPDVVITAWRRFVDASVRSEE